MSVYNNMNGEEFQKHLSTIHEHAVITMAMGLGNNLGLFRLLCKADHPMSVKEIAEKMDFKERYTLEWLSCMVTASIIYQDRETRLYSIPEAHRETLKINASFSGMLFPMASRANRLYSCFKKDGPYGITYEDCPDFFDWFGERRADMSEHDIELNILPRFKQQGFISRLESGIKVLDLGSGTGDYTFGLSKRFPNSHFTGVDFAPTAVKMSIAKCEEMGLNNVTFIHGDAQDLPENLTNNFDLVFAYEMLHDLPDPIKALAQIRKVMTNDAKLSLFEFGFHSDPLDNQGNSTAAMMYGFSIFICVASSMTMAPRQGYGACWGMEDIEKVLLDQKFKIENKTVGSNVFFFCSK